jgi:hypothetical protein
MKLLVSVGRHQTYRFLVSLGICVAILITSPPTHAVAPPRPGQPYAESICNTDPNIILCEDFNYPQNFTCTPVGSADDLTWINPGLTTSGRAQRTYCEGADFPATANFAAQPSGSPSGGNLYRMRPGIDPGGSTISGCILGDCDRNTGDTPQTYRNGTQATNDLYIRFQIYNADNPQWYWGDAGVSGSGNKILFLYPNQYTDRPSSNVDAGMGTGTNVSCNGKYWLDALAFRVGSNSGSYKAYPADANIEPYNPHFEYCTGKGAPNGQFGDATVPIDTSNPPIGNPDPGTIFRFRNGRWYTVEFRYRLSSPGVQNGTIEAWVDGVKVYGDNDLETCGGYGSSAGNCYAIHEIQLLGSWFNYTLPDYNAAKARNSYRLIDNLVVSKAYIGPPTSSVPAPTSSVPAAPSTLAVQ